MIVTGRGEGLFCRLTFTIGHGHALTAIVNDGGHNNETIKSSGMRRIFGCSHQRR